MPPYCVTEKIANFCIYTKNEKLPILNAFTTLAEMCLKESE